ncbi:hybrid sensor histidine kinase/response regulator transcription factor [Pedobacter sp. AW31-3R]|uniref:hybrid sensor histidine kinase/response regulator transcription factor n=1 Tax=Pedobacter sp. AW31-3R TaxID=3445781 RepID=UPI003FA05E82
MPIKVVPKLFLLCMFLFCPWCSWLAKGQEDIKCKIEHLTTENGLSHDGVMTMIKDKDGFMWFGTWDGINRYDGVNFVTYKGNAGDRTTLNNNRIDQIVEDHQGNLWLKAYDNQIYRFNKKTERFLSVAEIIKDESINFEKIILTRSGNIWLTTDGRGVFLVQQDDGAIPRIVNYQVNKDMVSPAEGKINFLQEDLNGNVWIGAKTALYLLKKNDQDSLLYKTYRLFKKKEAVCFLEGTDCIWFGFHSGEIATLDKRSQRFGLKRMSAGRINAMYCSKLKQKSYLTTSSGELIQVSPSLNETKRFFYGKALYSIFEDKRGMVWLEPENQGVIRFSPWSKSFKDFLQKRDVMQPTKYYNIFEDRDDRLWIATKGGGFGYYDEQNESLSYFYNQPGHAGKQFSNTVSSIYMDDQAKVLWLSTEDRGIHKIIFQPENFKYHLMDKDRSNKSLNEVRAIYRDSRNRVWLTSKSGNVVLMQNGKKLDDPFNGTFREKLQFIYTILEDRKGNIWLGTKGNGLFKATPLNAQHTKYTLRQFLTDEKDNYSIHHNHIYSLIEDRQGRIWIGTYGNGPGVIENPHADHIRFNSVRNTLRDYPIHSSPKIRSLTADSKGRIWMATTNGLVICDPQARKPEHYQFQSYRKVPGNSTALGSNDVRFVYQDSRNQLWIATSGGGLGKVVEAKNGEIGFKTFTKRNGLSSDYILGAVEDGHHNLWLTTENGISKLDLSKEQFRNYNSYDGLLKIGFSEESALRLKDGSLIFGCTEGYLKFYPDAIKDRQIKANLVLTSVRVNNKEPDLNADESPNPYNIAYAKSLRLRYNENTISIDYTTLDFRSNSKQSYAYRLRGFDEHWHDVKNLQKATYTNLPPGNYIFEVKCLNTELYSMLPIKRLSITIDPPIWKTKWAYFLYFVLLLLVLEVIRRITLSFIKLKNRIAVERQVTELKLSFFTNISHELRTPLTLITSPIEEIYKNEYLSPRGQEYIEIVRKNASRMGRFINYLLDFRKVQSGKSSVNTKAIELVSFMDQVVAYFAELAREKGILIRVESQRPEIFMMADTEKLEVIIYNLLSNALKFSYDHQQILIRIFELEYQSVQIDIVDKGIGVEETKLNDIFELYYEEERLGRNQFEGTGIGLALCKEYVALHKGRITARNNPDHGLTVTVVLPKGEFVGTMPEVVSTHVSGEDVDSGETEHQEFFPDVTDVQNGLENPLVLIVEDNDDLRKFLWNQLSDNYRVITAENGLQGLKKAKEFLPDIILSDIMMPEMDGIEMLDKIRNEMSTSHIPVILLTARSTIAHKIRGLDYGADAYITKPFETDFLRVSIESLIKQRKRIFESILRQKTNFELAPSEITITTKDEAFLKEVITIVENEMEKADFSIDSFADTVGLGRATFNRKFKSLTHMTPVEFVRDMRLKRAKQLFDAGDHNIAVIAYSVGFNSAGYFSTCFKEKYGMAPTEYIKKQI